jgi:arylsulfatase A-like enzyme
MIRARYYSLSAILTLLIVLAVTILYYKEARARKAAKTGKPNIVLVLADDAGYGDFGCYGQQKIRTPEIDALAGEGMLFTDHYAAAPVCAPSRCGLLTGLHTGHASIRGNEEIIPEGQRPLPADDVTMAEVLKKAGYTTAVIGKWGLGGPGTEGEPNRQGFDHWFGYLCQRQAHTYYPEHLWRNGERVALDGKTYTHDLFTKEALEFIKENREGPFFLFLAYALPHAKLQVPDLGEYANKDWPEAMKKYAAMVSRLDRDVGRVKNLIDELGLEKNTLIIVTSDNGPHAEGGADPEFFNSAGGLRGIKRDLYEGGIRVPFIARMPGTVPVGSKSEAVSAFWDLLPTFARMAGLEPPPSDGLSLAPVLRGEEKSMPGKRPLYWEFHERGGHQALRYGRWKAHRHMVRFNPDAPLELYDLEKDPAETTDIASGNPDVVAMMEGKMDQARTRNQAFPLMGRQKYHPGPYNGWIYAVTLPLAALILCLVGGVTGRSGCLRELKQGMGGKVAFISGLLVRAGLVTVAALLPIWFFTWRESWGMGFAVAGLAGFIFFRIWQIIKKEPASPSRTMGDRGKLASEVLFWIGVALATASDVMLLLVLLLLVIRFRIGENPGEGDKGKERQAQT